MARKQYKKTHKLITITSFMLILLLLVTASKTLSIEKFGSNRNARMNIVSATAAGYIGVDILDSYMIEDVLEPVNFYIINNFPDRVTFILELTGDTILSYDPQEFILNPGESIELSVFMGDYEEFREGDYPITGKIYASYAKGKCEVDIATNIEMVLLLQLIPLEELEVLDT